MEHGPAIVSKPILSVLKSCPKNLSTRSTFAVRSREWPIGHSAIALFSSVRAIPSPPQRGGRNGFNHAPLTIRPVDFARQLSTLPRELSTLLRQLSTLPRRSEH